VDPSGQVLIFFGTSDQYRQLEEIANQGLNGFKLAIDKSGRASLKKTETTGVVTPQQDALAKILGSIIDNQKTVEIGLTSGAPDVRGGSYVSEEIDINDIRAFGSGPITSSYSVLAHEISEQAAKQFLGFTDNDFSDAWFSHQVGIVAQNLVSGYTRSPGTQKEVKSPSVLETTSHFRRGQQQFTVTVIWKDGNVYKIKR
jgi:hypothetical protein